MLVFIFFQSHCWSIVIVLCVSTNCVVFSVWAIILEAPGAFYIVFAYSPFELFDTMMMGSNPLRLALAAVVGKSNHIGGTCVLLYNAAIYVTEGLPLGRS